MTKNEFIKQFVLNMSSHSDSYFRASDWASYAAEAYDVIEQLAPTRLRFPNPGSSSAPSQ